MTGTRAGLLLLLLLTFAVVWAGLSFVPGSRADKSVSLSDLPGITHIHGIAVDARNPSRLLLATHHGFFVVTPDGMATRVSDTRDDFMGFTPHPSEPETLYASGHPADGGNLGFVVSPDGGKTWRRLSAGANGPVDFHQMDVSKADPAVIYGAFRGLQISRDGGRSWNIVAPAPDGLIALAASSRDTDSLFAATRYGLLLSTDSGRSWQNAGFAQRPTSMVETTADGDVYAFVVGVGLVRATESARDWTVVSREFGDRILLHFAVDPTAPDRLYAVTQHSEVLASKDGGRSWTVLGGS